MRLSLQYRVKQPDSYGVFLQDVCVGARGPACNRYPSLQWIPFCSLQNTRKPRLWSRTGRWGLTGKGRRSGNPAPFTPACSSRRWTSASSRPSTSPCRRGQTWQPNWAWHKPRYCSGRSSLLFYVQTPATHFSVFTQKPNWPLSTFPDRTMWAKTIEPSCSSSASESLMSGNCWIVGIRWPWQGILTEFWNLNRNSSDSRFAWFTATLKHCTHVQGTAAIIISGQKNTTLLIKNTPSRAASLFAVQFQNAFLTPEPEQFSAGLSEPHRSWIPSAAVFWCILFLCFCTWFFSSPLKQDQPQQRDSKFNYCLFFPCCSKLECPITGYWSEWKLQLIAK